MNRYLLLLLLLFAAAVSRGCSDNDGNSGTKDASSGSVDGESGAGGNSGGSGRNAGSGGNSGTKDAGSGGLDGGNGGNAGSGGDSGTINAGSGGVTGGSGENAGSSSNSSTSWIRQLGSQFNDQAVCVTTDSSGNVYVAGGTKGGLDGNTNAGVMDIFVTKYDSVGDKQWTRQLGTKNIDGASGVATDSNGNVYIAGVEGDLEDLSNGSVQDVFLTKYNNVGDKQWTRQLGTASEENAFDTATDVNGNIYVVGYTVGGFDSNINAGKADLFVVKYDNAGDKLWTRQLGTEENDVAYDVATDGSGNVYVAGHTMGSLDGNTNAGDFDLFAVKYNSAGDKLWTRQLGTEDYETASGVATDNRGNVYVVGYTGGALDGNTKAGLYDLFVVKYDSAGDKLWTRQFGTISEDLANDVATDSSGNVYVVGSTAGSLDGNINAGKEDLFVVKYNSAGDKLWTKQLGTAYDDSAHGVAIDRSDNIYVVGYTEGGLDGNINAGNFDLFVIKYNGDDGEQ
jgi:hypothetical protein